MFSVKLNFCRQVVLRNFVIVVVVAVAADLQECSRRIMSPDFSGACWLDSLSTLNKTRRGSNKIDLSQLELDFCFYRISQTTTTTLSLIVIQVGPCNIKARAKHGSLFLDRESQIIWPPIEFSQPKTTTTTGQQQLGLFGSLK